MKLRNDYLACALFMAASLAVPAAIHVNNSTKASVIRVEAPRKKDRPRILRTYAPNGVCIPGTECSAESLVVENPLKFDVDVIFYCGQDLLEPTVTLPADKTSTVLITSNTERGLNCSISTWTKTKTAP